MKNPNTHPEHQLKELAKSLDRFSQVKNIVVWNGFFLAGHGLAMAAEKEGLEELVAVDVSEWDEQTAIEFMIADNRLPELSVMDNEMLASVFADFEMPKDIPGVDDDFLNTIDVLEYSWEEAFSALPDEDREPFQRMTFVLHDSQIAGVKEALKIANSKGAGDTINENSNGNSLSYICLRFINDVGQRD
jgi:hypothetical protein